MSNAKVIDQYPQPKPAEKQAEKQIQAQARQEQRRSDAAATVVEKDTQNVQGQSANSEVTSVTSVSAAQPAADNSNAPAPMKQQVQGNAATNVGGRGVLLVGGHPTNAPRPSAPDSKQPPRVVRAFNLAA